MSGAEATAEFEPAIKELGDQLVKLSILEAKSLGDYIKEEYGIEPAAGGAVMMAGPAGAAEEAVEEKTEFDVVLTSFGDNKIPVIKVVRAATGLGLKEAKELVEGVPKAVKEAVSEDDAKKLKEEIESAGGSCEIK